VLAHPARPWDLRPIDAEDPSPPDPDVWPAVGVVIPARNEADLIAGTIACHQASDYPGHVRIVVVDERSTDATGDRARTAAATPGARHLTKGEAAPRRVTTAGDGPGARHVTGAGAAAGAWHVTEVITGGPLPDGWVGKVWGMEQGLRMHEQAGAPPEWILFTDADIRHSPDSLRALVAAAMHNGVGLESRMARLRCRSTPERLLIPPFVLFFFLLYPMRWANRARSRRYAAAGGCILVQRNALAAGGGLASVKGALIDDLAIARLVKRRAGMPTRLALSRTRVTSVRAYDDVASVWTMVRRSAFTELRQSWLLLTAVTAVLLMMFAGPLVAVGAGAVGALTGGGAGAGWAVALGAAGWACMAAAAGPVTREFGLAWPWRLALPVSGMLYGAMTIDSALRGPKGGGWR
jgi:hopene-associated glycosyltransferase HpnB